MLRAAKLAIVTVTALILTGCVGAETEYAHGSREKLYYSVEEVASDSSTIVIGTVSSSAIVKDEYGASATVSQFKVLDVIQGGQTEGKGAVNTGDSLGIRQLGTSETLGLGAPILESGKTYLLFLTASMLQGEVEATQFYVTGASAGYYELDGSPTEELSTATFKKVGDEGDSLPANLTASDVLEAIR